MATSVYTDFKVYNDQFQGGFIETIQQNVDAFNAASAGALTLSTRDILGHYEIESFFDEVISAGSGIARRDISSTSSATAIKLTMDEFVGVKLNRINGPYEVNIDAFRKAGRGKTAEAVSQEFSHVIGTQTAKVLPQEMLNRTLAALEAKLDSVAALEHGATASPGLLETEDLVDALALAGDSAGGIKLWVMHSRQYFQLLKDQIADAVYRADGMSIMQGTPATLGRPVLVTDSTSLVEASGVSSGVSAYSVLGLRAGAAVLDMSEAPIAVLEGPLTGRVNLFFRWQAEYAYNLKIKGCQWDQTNGGVNPTDSAVATATNWDTVVADNKLLPGVIIKCR